jgi:uncharacterized protein (DUF1800 family)
MAATDLLGEEGAAHLLRRAGFGGEPGEAQQLAGRTRLAAVQQLLGTKTRRKAPPSGRNDGFENFRKMQRWWLTQMRSPKWRLHEKMALFWHDHFPSAYQKIRNLKWLATQNALFRERGLGNFRDLAYLVTRDAAMLEYLDGLRNRAENPNENYARELMELFVLGREDLNGQPNYTQEDVVQLARAVTGFGFLYNKKDRRTDTVILRASQFDAGVKTLFAGKPYQATGNLGVEDADGNPFPPNLNVIDILFTHTDSDGRPTAARFVAKKLWEWFAHPQPDVSLVDELADVFVAAGYEIRALVQAILTHDAFYSEQAMSSTAKTPVDFALQTILALGVQTSMEELTGVLDRMGMSLFDPPSVNGWNHSEAWLATSRYRERFTLAQAIAAGRSKKEYKLRPEKLLDPTAATSGEIVDGLLARLGVRNVPAASRQALIDYVDGGLALGDDEWLEIKFRGLLVLILTLPEFQLH